LLPILAQLFTTITAPLAILLLGRGSSTGKYENLFPGSGRKAERMYVLGCLLGLGSQVGFVFVFCLGRQYLMLLTCLVYTGVWLDNYKRRPSNVKR
jgi:multisubunit Na+/H+ antiporter MnhG subunit